MDPIAHFAVNLAREEVRTRDDSIDRLPQLRPGDRVRMHEGTFDRYVGEVRSIDSTWGSVTIQVEAFGQMVPVECARSRLEIAS